MKQSSIVKNKLWDALRNKRCAYFPVEFYSKKDVLKGLDIFDLRHVNVDIRFGKTNKGFDAFIVRLSINYKWETLKGL